MQQPEKNMKSKEVSELENSDNSLVKGSKRKKYVETARDELKMSVDDFVVTDGKRKM